MSSKKKQVAARNALGAALIFMFAAAPGAFAAEWYGGVGFGQAKVKKELGCSDFAGIPGVTCSEDRKDTALRLFGGTELAKNVAVEFGYRDLGEAKLNATDGVDTATLKAEVKGFDVSVVGTLPVGTDFGVIGRVGFFRWDLDVKVDETGFPSESFSKSGTDLAFGVGVKYNLSKTMALRAEWERLKDLKVEDFKTDIDVMSVSLAFNF